MCVSALASVAADTRGWGTVLPWETTQLTSARHHGVLACNGEGGRQHSGVLGGVLRRGAGTQCLAVHARAPLPRNGGPVF